MYFTISLLLLRLKEYYNVEPELMTTKVITAHLLRGKKKSSKQ